jgi:Icc-related predicted phosphoesterase
MAIDRRRWALVLVSVLVGAAAALALVGLLSPYSGDVGPGRVQLEARCCTDHRTDLVLPPFGRVSADTHAGPLALSARVRSVDVDAVRSLVQDDDPQGRLAREAEDDLRPLVLRFVVRATVLAGVVGALATALLPWRRWSHLPLGAAGGILAVGGVLGLAALTFDPEAFAQPRFEGPLAEAPRIIEAVERNVEDFDEVRSRIDVLAAQLGELYATSVTDDLAGVDGEVRILHVSDIHLNPVGLEVVAQLAEEFEVDAVLDTGDLTTFGLPFESRVLGLIDDLAIPYLLVPGNHDSDANRRGLARFDGVTVLDPGTVTVGDVRIAGIGHPAFTASNELDDEAVQAAVQDQQPEVESLVAAEQPDILAVHDPDQADIALGEVPLVVAGHVHEHRVEEHGGTVLATSGSTGATGLGSFTVDTDLAYEAEVLRLVDGRLRSIDAVALRGTNGEFRIDRQVFDAATAPTIDFGL